MSVLGEMQAMVSYEGEQAELPLVVENVPVLKGNKKSIHTCGDFKLTVNKALRLDKYPIPKIENILTGLAGGKSFMKLDMCQAYQ